MATTAVAALPVAAAEAVFTAIDWGAGPSITALHMARGQAFYFIASDGRFWEVGEGIYRDITSES